ncbi:DUF502 domain-containing protein [Paraglaciecola chathamensis]|jgi:uncharacterized membrane protein|uniref:Transporter n=3 Tax=Paraglaciecola chathamensis TaxID=368405 RepID=A0A8H9I6U7_9ALTE|nr:MULTISPECIES: DUF502 domain-containing protein [Paraglaciecola]AEE21858.1 protein of unknown function DUF502 [Glaciecola sp. 4H-3-7+YE-5]MDO6558895.1 DUF502 domain-containing protein [Paraglaciecola chathamensis]MDO6841327.1 DUF502 domain-containing protein [Paraglaciecola chathamensis]GAC04680.1 hypothetical protein GAGA_1825 [Paraglaciecola agarilytica NO2]GAC11134.1 hypothetical protein GCHA_3195 [Paraglaciecola chathamensis S18K6]
MLKKIMLLVVQGLLAVVPITLTIYALYWLITSVERTLTPIIPAQYYFPGLGVVTGIVLLFFAGLLVNAYVIKVLLRWGERLFERIPLVKTFYGAIQDAVNLINVGKQQKMQSVVSVQISDSIHLIGFVTNIEGGKTLFKDEEKIGVYIPLSYQIGGYTLYIDRSKVTPLDIDVESAMRIALTGGSQSKSDFDKPESKTD